jgi:hypothetical protein
VPLSPWLLALLAFSLLRRGGWCSNFERPSVVFNLQFHIQQHRPQTNQQSAIRPIRRSVVLDPPQTPRVDFAIFQLRFRFRVSGNRQRASTSDERLGCHLAFFVNPPGLLLNANARTPCHSKTALVTNQLFVHLTGQHSAVRYTGGS